jgi:aspartate/methionine/tyrosine aminotransferase
MQIKDFALERYFARFEFKAKYLLSSSDCDGFSMQFILDQATENELDQWKNLRLGYTETRGSEELRAAIAHQYQNIGTDRIVVGSPGELNFGFMNILLNRGDEVISMSPMYQSMYQVAKSIGCKIKFWKPDLQQKRWYYDPAKLETLITPKTKLIVVNFPHNPTGFAPSKSDLNAIISIARKHGIVLFSDEMYHEMTHNPQEQTQSVADLYENGVALWGMAKTFGMGGLRIGWLASQNNDLLTKVESYKDYLSICNSATSEVLSTITLRHKEAFVVPNMEKIAKNIAIFQDFCTKNSKFVDFPMPNAGSTAFVKLKIKGTAMDFSEKLVTETGIMLLPSETFEYGTKHARIGFGRAAFGEILKVLDVYLEKNKDLLL